ncbi:O-methyltransferase MdmC [Octopus sinensis]|uniref:O-methyltransferase MdmC n=1 Tax=Octopus sinensis TaxID=2607531 RepID=A0A6P7TJB0_9MOLL|nr:O-methyltransferase MdmC [Octopus sinensis]XP_036367950.1 O-methyltransferase MdmC [Octopus sinensis]XP_036367951.1 O-methyltransferase MdmC [Octopus sinensis]
MDNSLEGLNLYDPAVKELKLWYETTEDKETKERLLKILQMHIKRDCYSMNLNTPVTPVRREILQFTNTNNWELLAQQKVTQYRLSPNMASGEWAGQVLKMLVSMQKAKTVIEIGMFTGFASLSMAEALPADGQLFACDIEPYLEKSGRSFFDKSPHGKKITVKIGPALETLKTLAKEGVKADFIFIDADKSGYVDYFKSALDNNILAPRGTIAFDNIYWFGEPYLQKGCENTVMARVQKAIIDDPRVEQVLLPVRDGIALVRRVEDI